MIEERAGLLSPHGRDGPGRAVERIRSGEAGAVLTAWRSMISSGPQEYDEVAREFREGRGFPHVRDSAHSGRRVTR